MIIIFKILQVIVALSFLIAIHELGHFVFARLFGIKVDKFFLFFDLGGIKLFSTKTTKWFVRLFPKMKDIDTEYGIGWLPIGGYCKICGMIDESLDMDTMKQEPKPWEFRTKPAWQRMLVMFGGVLFNFLLAIFIYIGVFASYGEEYLRNSDNSIYVNELAYDMGFRNGDKILRFDDYVPDDFSMLQADLARRSVNKAVVLRGADTVTLYIDKKMIGEVLESPRMFSLAIPFVVDSVSAGNPNVGKLMGGDRIVGLDDVSIGYIQDAWKVLSEKSGGEVEAKIVRGKDTLTSRIVVDTTGRIGVYLQVPGLQRKDYSLIEAVPAGVRYTFDTVVGYVRDLKLVATPSTGAYKSVGSFISIGQIFPSSIDVEMFVNILALLSIMLGVMNLIPIPGLDGGHIVLLLCEIVTGKKPSDTLMTVLQIIGMILLVILMVFACGNDIGRLIG